MPENELIQVDEDGIQIHIIKIDNVQYYDLHVHSWQRNPIDGMMHCECGARIFPSIPITHSNGTYTLDASD